MDLRCSARAGELQRILKTVIISAYDDMENIRAAMNGGAYDFLTKPIDFSDLEKTIAKSQRELLILRQGQRGAGQISRLWSMSYGLRPSCSRRFFPK